ncbi:hypothetical protein KC730_01290 [Candidatus Kaiserbacteria bacterium]|nr:hypothetical protein [Candidatus Kaiserbacteria bacterium]
MKSLKINITQILTLSFILFLFIVSFASANTVVRSGETVSIAEDQTVEGDVYAAAGTINVSGVINEDAVIMGGQVTLNGKINQDAFLLAGGVDVHGPVGDDLRIVSGEITIADEVAGDLFVMGGSVRILSSANIAGDVVLYAGDAVIEGFVGGDIIGTTGNLRIVGTVDGNIDITVNKLVFGDRANIKGSVTYVSSQKLERSLNATLVNDPVRNDPIIPQDNSHPLSWLVPSLLLLFSVAVWFLLSKKSLNIVVTRSLQKSPRPFLIGIVTFFFTPIAVGLLLVSMIGSLLSFTLLLSYFLFIALSFIAVIAVIGQILMIAFNRSSTRTSLISLVVGVLGFTLLSMLPVLGQTIIFAFVLLTLGAMVDVLIRPKLEKTK